MYFQNCKTIEELKAAYHALAIKHHPDHGGNLYIMQEINTEYEETFERMKNAGETNFHHEDGSSWNPYANETAAEFIRIIDQLIRMRGITAELCGCWIWISGDTKDHKDALKAAGCSWAPKKGMWYWRPSYERGKRRGNTPMDRIRETYGSRMIKDDSKAMAI